MKTIINNHVNRRRCWWLLAFVVILSQSSAKAQSSDFGLGISVGAEKKIDNHWSVGVEGEMRTRDNTGTVDRWSGGVDVGYKFNKWLKASVGYSLLYDNRDKTTYKTNGDVNKIAKFWSPRHRFNVSLTGQYKLGRIKFSLRERWQFTYRPEKTVQRWDVDDEEWEDKTYSSKSKHLLRSRLQAAWDIPKCKFTPYANVELFNGMSLEKTRFIVGCDWDVTKQHSVGLLYRFQHVRDSDADDEPDMHLIGLSYKYTF
ncbi:MAG: DUF2490 domain-containing protein [Prevotella sp.]|nr:DUF2490 domain-containing protein [Prevotella sp.]